MIGINENWAGTIEVRPQDHVLVLVESEPISEVVVPYVASGLRKNHVCPVVAPASQRGFIWDEIESLGFDPENGDDLFLFQPEEMGVESQNRFNVHLFLERMKAFVDEQWGRGIEHVRVTGIMRWVSEITRYEGAVSVNICTHFNDLMADRPVSGFCVYDCRDVGGDTLMELVRAHPKVLVDGKVVDNPFYSGWNRDPDFSLTGPFHC